MIYPSSQLVPMTRLEDVLAGIDHLEPFPRTAVRVLELALGDAASSEIVAVIEQDPGLTGKVLGLANSASSGAKVEIESVFAATNRLGIKAVANLALTSGASSVFQGYGSATSRSNESLWIECLYTACFARRLAKDDGRVDHELAYTVGLLQNIGHIVLDRFLEEEREQIAELLEGGRDLLAAERAALGFDHAQCGALIVRRWGFPRRLVRGIQFHHSPASAGEEALSCTITGLAEELALQLLAGHDGRPAYLAPRGGRDLARPAEEALEELEGLVTQDIADLSDQ